YVTRGLLCYVWEPFDAGGNVIETRQAQRWLRELVGSVDFTSLAPEELREEIVRLMLLAVVGTSRLPLTSVEAPLPGFSLGRLAYLYRTSATGGGPLRHAHELIRT